MASLFACFPASVLTCAPASPPTSFARAVLQMSVICGDATNAIWGRQVRDSMAQIAEARTRGTDIAALESKFRSSNAQMKILQENVEKQQSIKKLWVWCFCQWPPLSTLARLWHGDDSRQMICPAACSLCGLQRLQLIGGGNSMTSILSCLLVPETCEPSGRL